MKHISMGKIRIKCYEKNGIYIRGSAFYRDLYYSSEQIYLKLIKKSNISEIVQFVNSLNGHFSIVVDNSDFTIAFQDRFSTYHLCYSHYKNKLYVSDDTLFIVKETNQYDINTKGYSDLIYTGFINFNETFVNNIFKVMPREYILYNKKENKVTVEKYNFYSYKRENIYSDKEAEINFKAVFSNVAKRLEKRLNGRQAVVMLSGGVDSRFCALLLKEIEYENVILVTYGNRLSKEYRPAINAAKKLGYKHYFIPYKKSNWAKTYKNKESLEYITYSTNLMVNAHLREHFVIKQLLKKEIIKKDSIIIPGHIGNIAGRSFYSSKNIHSNLNSIMFKSRMLFYNTTNLQSKHMQYLIKRVKNITNNLNQMKDTYKICETYEKYSLESYTVLYLVNSVRAYDFYGLNWYMPLLDNELVDFFAKIKIEEKYKKNYLYTFVNNKLPNLSYAEFPNKYMSKLINNLLDKRYSCISVFNAFTLKCEANKHLPIYKRVYRYFRNFSAYCAVVETDIFKKQLKN